GVRHHILDAPPGELHWRTVRHFRGSFDRLRPLEQADRAGREERVCFFADLYVRHCAGNRLGLPPPPLCGRVGVGGNNKLGAPRYPAPCPSPTGGEGTLW